MAYQIIEDFSAGLDLRKSSITSAMSSLRTLNNGFISVGGEIEKRMAMPHLGAMSPGQTHGLAFNNDKLVVFGTLPPGSIDPLPDNTVYQQLITAKTISRVLDVQLFGAYLYVVARMTDGTIEHFNGTGLVSATGTNARPFKSKMYAVDGQNLRFSSVLDASDWAGTGSGIIDVSTEDAGAANLVGLEQYYGNLALFGYNSVQIWNMDPDPALNTKIQTLGNIGLVAPNALASHGNGDVLFVSHTGIRSLRARNSSNAAVLNDIGSPLDPLIRELRNTLSDDVVDRMAAIVDPLTGHLWLVWDQTVLILAYYPNSKITAWSTFEFPLQIDHIVVAGTRVVIRSGDNLFMYGPLPAAGSPFDPNSASGVVANRYDQTQVEIVTPFYSLQQPATRKRWTGFDIACTGVWDIYVDPDHKAEGVWTHIGQVSGNTFNLDRIPVDVEGTHLALKLISVGAGPASLASLGIHFTGGDAG